MGTVESVVMVAALQQSLFALLWLLAARQRLAPRASRHWAAGNALIAAALFLALARPLDAAWAPWVGWVAANLVLLAGYATVVRGTSVFARRPPPDGLYLVAAAVLGAALVPAIATGRSPLAAAATGAVIGVLMLHAAARVARDFTAESGRSVARLCALPLALLAGLFWLRAVVALQQPQALGQTLYRDHPANLSMVFALAVFAILLNFALAALVTARLLRRLEHQSTHDALTGVLNRRGLQGLMAREASRHQRFGHGWAVVAVDVDHFKRVNDRHGHGAGDAVLVRVARALAATAREVDSVGRMGGEEFVVLLPGCDAAGAEQVAQRLVGAARTLVHPELGDAVPVTVSAGVAVARSRDDTVGDLLRRVDRALYAAKAAGRDRVVVDGSAQSPAGDTRPARYA